MKKDYLKIFASELEDVGKLINTPNEIQKIALDIVKAIDLSVLPNTERRKTENGIKALENISTVSMSKSFDVIYNQVCILAVSAFEVNVERYFKNFLNSNWNNLDIDGACGEKFESIKLNLKELSKYNFQLIPSLGEIVITKDGSINFQDLGSIVRSFEKYLGKNIVLEVTLRNEVTFYLQCRHLLVHKNGIVDKEFIKKIPSNYENKYKEGEKIRLNEQDWVAIRTGFTKALEIIVS